MLRLERYKALISGSHPLQLETWVRGLLIHYFFHVSDKLGIEVMPDPAGGARRSINVLTPTVFKGAGRIRLGATTVFGVPRSPGSCSCSYIESRTPQSLIEIGEGCVLNNRAVLISEGARIRFGVDCLVGPELYVSDSNSHELAPARRRQPDSRPRAVEIGNEVFIGARVTILKGARIGDGCVVAAGAVLAPDFEAPPLSIIAGNPARIVGRVRTDEAAGA